MTCSKLFSGDLPEITSYIIQYLRNYLRSLHSCILVNRLLCQIAVPVLWEDPFSARYLLFSNDNYKTKLKAFGITINIQPLFKKPLFDYPKFIKTFNIFRVRLHMVN